VNSDEIYLIHIRDAIHDINDFVIEGRDAFLASKLIQSAVLYKLQTLAESTQRLSDATKAARPEVSWRAIRGLRNVLAHDYTNIKLEEIWNIIERDLPTLKTAVEAMLQDLGQDPDKTS
jgi:uncharacterized protein with HEPN domain